MERQSIKDLVKEVAGPNAGMVDHQNWVSISCWFAPWKHGGGRDAKPSAGISVKKDERSIYNCQTCGMKGTLPYILEQLSAKTGEDYTDLLGGIDDEEFYGGDLQPWGVRPKDEAEAMPEPLDPDVYLDLYDTAYDHWYVSETRGIDEDTARFIDLRVDPSDSAGEERILFPVYNHRGGFYGFTGRATRDGVYPPVRDYHGLPKRGLLLGSHLLPRDAKRVIVVEGLFDFARLIQYGQPAVAYMGGSLTELQVQVLIDIDLPVYYFRDNDETGERAQLKIVEELTLCKHVPVMKVRYPKRLVLGKDGKRRPIKDPDELSEEEVETMLAEARLLVS